MLLTRTYATLVACLLLASTAVAERPPHPEPRVIVNVIDVKGPHSPAAVQRSARFGWGRIVNCYKSTGNNAAGKLTAELLVSGAGRVTRARKMGSTLKSAELTSCLAQCLTGLTMPKADQNSTATLEIQVAPGDPP